MTKKPEQSVHTILAKGQGPLGYVLAKVEQLRTLNQQIQTLLRPELAQHCQVANLRDGCLILQVDNAAWATQLRFEQTELLSKLRKQPALAGLASIKIQVRAPDAM